MSKRKNLWNFSQKNTPSGQFSFQNADKVNRLYFPLFNLNGMMSAVTPELKGDLKTGQNSFILEPQVTENILQTKTSRNFWVKTDSGKIISLTGVSAEEQYLKASGRTKTTTDVEAAPGWFKVIRNNKKLKIKSEITSFVPSNGDPLEIHLVEIKNIGDAPLKITPFSAIPMYCRSADNLRDHRQVTTLLNRVEKLANGIIVKPTMLFDETGHKPGVSNFSAFGFQDENTPLKAIVADQETFIGEGGSLEAPELIYSKKDFSDTLNPDGRQIIAAFKYQELTLNPGEVNSFVTIIGMHSCEENIQLIMEKYNSPEKARLLLNETISFWQNQVEALTFNTGNETLDNWLVWVSLQPVMRRVYGCSFLPDFGYGRGGRGWRDLWQDCLGILLTNPYETREILLNNIQGVRIDGSNATIIGLKPGEFIADRNNIPRTWMDHGVWPLMTIDFYVQQTGDYKILLEKRSFFQDRFSHRSKKINSSWLPEQGTRLKTVTGEEYESEIMLHLLLQNITQFFNRGDNGNIRLEDADWNDGLDMAHKKGESVPFTAAFAGNLLTLADLFTLLSEQGIEEFLWPTEIKTLLEVSNNSLKTLTPEGFRNILFNYFTSVEKGISGNLEKFNVQKVATSLKDMSVILKKQISDNEFIETEKASFFNGYYNNDGDKTEGLIDDKINMTLTGQVFPVMSGCATNQQARKSFKAAKEYLKDPVHKGFRLNTDFGKTMLDLGRAYSFSYGDKENGSVFSHMCVMFSNALYRQGLINEAYEVLDSLFLMASNTDKSKIFPCLPEYFNAHGRGLYCYITGSASWYIMTMVIEVFGIRGNLGKLTFKPKLSLKQFKASSELSINTLFQGKKISVTYVNENLLPFNKYKIDKITLNDQPIDFTHISDKEAMPAVDFNSLNNSDAINFKVYLN